MGGCGQGGVCVSVGGEGGWLRRGPVEKMCNAMVKETRGGLSDSIERGGGEMESGASAYVLSTSSHTIMQMWEETDEGSATVAVRRQN